MMNLNTYNVLPFYNSKNDWYDKRKTFAGIHSHIYMGQGYIPFTQLAGNVNALSLQVTVTDMSGQSIAGVYSTTSPDWDSVKLDSGAMPYSIIVQKQPDGRYLIFLTDGVNTWDGYHTSIGGVFFGNHQPFTTAQLKAGHVYFAANFNTLYSECSISGLLGSATVTGATLALVNCESGTETNITASVPVTADYIPAQYANNNMTVVVSFGNVTLNPYKVGSHYLKLTIDSNVYYSDVFQFTENTDNLIAVNYSRNVPVVTPTDYFNWQRNAAEVKMRMYLPSALVTPPYEFEEEVINLDGYEFVTKRVSYMKHHTEFSCSSLFANALRLLWHCNNISITYQNITKSVNYMDAPDIRWEESNHLCIAAINFKTDTILQTNGEVKRETAVSGHNSYNNSFNISFN